MSKTEPDLDEVYAILRLWAVAEKYRTYGELSQEYRARTGQWFDPHGSWDAPLGALNTHIHASFGGPALSALVVLKIEKEPGGGFWGCAPNVPSRPKTPDDRFDEWSRIVKEVFAYEWPATLP
jgi:hypothetical protein